MNHVQIAINALVNQSNHKFIEDAIIVLPGLREQRKANQPFSPQQLVFKTTLLLQQR
jgi:hypothetical protein